LRRPGAGLRLSLPCAAACVLCASLFQALPVQAAHDISYDFRARERFEVWNGYNKKAYGDDSINPKGVKQGEAFDNFILQRVVFGFSGEGERFGWRFDMYDARSWGTSLDKNDFIKNAGTDQQYFMVPYEEYLEPYELYFKIKGLGTEKSRLIVGRQIIGFGNSRIFGPGAVTNSIGWLWDAARYSLRYEDKFVDAWYGQTKTQDPDSLSLLNEYAYQGVGVYGHWPFADLGTVEPFFSWKDGLFYDNGARNSLYYLGARAVRSDLEGLVYDITVAWELGSREFQDGSPDADVDAYGYAIKLGWFFKKIPFTPKIMLGRDYASGDSDPSGGDMTTFTRPFGTTDGGHYGIMDLMSWSNMIDNHIDIHLTPWQGYNFRVVYHDFYLDEKADKWAYFGYKVANNLYDHVGNEFDIILTCKPFSRLKVMAFYGHFRAGDFITKNDIAQNDADRMVVQLNFSF
jgi:hypothetical protein